MAVTRAADAGPEASRPGEAGMIGAVAQWCECLHGKAPLLRGGQALASGLEAEAAAVVRYPLQGRSDGRPLVWDSAAPGVRGGRLERGFARSLFGGWLEAARPGTLWFRSMADESGPELTEFHAQRGLRELVVLPLETTERHFDTLELHFAERPRGITQALLNSLAPVAAQTWRNRIEGLFTEAVLRRIGAHVPAPAAGPVLGSDNPARLSRAEYRVGLMLSRGLSPAEVRAELGIRESTLRTHLGNLYAKTGAASLSELIFLLVSAAPYSARGGQLTERRA